MHEHRFHGDPARLRRPERLAYLELPRVVELSLRGGGIKRVLDVGAGTGVFSEAFAAAGLHTEGVDANPEILAEARRLLPAIPFHEGLAETLPFPADSFDLVFMGLLLHETDDPLAALCEAARVSRGRIIILEWPYLEQEVGPGLDERLSEARLAELAAGANLTLADTIPLQTLILYHLEKNLPA
jgi:SAM-dependent methyltransferase